MFQLVNIAVPLRFNESNDLDKVIDLAAIKQSIEDVLLTEKGSIMFMEGYGSKLHYLFHNPVNISTAEAGKTYIYIALYENMPKILIKGISYVLNNKTITYRILYNIIGESLTTQEANITLNF